MVKNSLGLEYVERSKSKALLDMLSSTTILPSEKLKKKYPDLLEQERNLKGKLRLIQTRQLRTINSTATSLDKPVKSQSFHQAILLVNKSDPNELNRILKDLDEIYDIFNVIDSDYVRLRKGRSITFEEVCKMI